MYISESDRYEVFNICFGLLVGLVIGFSIGVLI